MYECSLTIQPQGWTKLSFKNPEQIFKHTQGKKACYPQTHTERTKECTLAKRQVNWEGWWCERIVANIESGIF